MKDKQTETNLRLIALQLESWKKLHDLITYGLDKAKPIISVDQERFNRCFGERLHAERVDAVCERRD